MSELTLTVIRLGFLVLLWVLVLTVVSVMRADLRAPRVAPRVPRRSTPAPAARTAKPPRRRGSPVTIGRAPDSTLVLDDDYASTRHARLAPDAEGRWFVEDLGSTNGTYVGRGRINGPTEVSTGSTVRIGKTVLELRK